MTTSNISKSKSDNLVSLRRSDTLLSYSRVPVSDPAAFKTPYRNPPPFVAVNFNDAISRTSQEFVKDCDINNIIAMQKKGLTPHMKYNPADAKFADVSDLPDFQTARGFIAEANEAFSQLPAKVRKAFGNDPAEFMDAFQDEARRPELERLGLVKKASVASQSDAGEDLAPSKSSTPPKAKSKPADAGEAK